MIKDYFRFAINTFSHRRTRSYLTMIGIFIGIAAVVSLISLGQGLQNAIDYQFQKIGADRILITPGGAIAGPASGELTVTTLTEHDVDVVRGVKGIEFATGAIIRNANVEFRDEVESITVIGFDTDAETTKYIENVGLFDIDTGRNPKSGEKFRAVIGRKVAEDFFERELEPGDELIINGREFEIIGIQKNIGTGLHDQIIRIPKETAKELFGTEELNYIFAKAKKGSDTNEVAEAVKKALRKDHNVEKGKEDFSVETSQKVVQSFSNILVIVQAVFVGIAAISLLVGGIGIMNTMYTSVLERTREIGIMKAIGAKNSDIMSIFLIESGILGLIGGATGLLIGAGIAKSVEYAAVQQLGVYFLKVNISFYLIVGALAFSFIVGALSGMMPARQAAKLNAVDALRYRV